MMCFSSCRLLFEHLNVAVNGWGWATTSFFWTGLRAYVIFSNGVARWKRLGTTVLEASRTVYTFCQECTMLSQFLKSPNLIFGLKRSPAFFHVSLVGPGQFLIKLPSAIANNLTFLNCNYKVDSFRSNYGGFTTRFT